MARRVNQSNRRLMRDARRRGPAERAAGEKLKIVIVYTSGRTNVKVEKDCTCGKQMSTSK